MNPPSRSDALSANPFYTTPQQRVALAREHYFENGVRPSGMVSEAVIQSWNRCLQARQDPAEAVAFNPVSASRIHSVLGRNRLLLEVAAQEMEQLRCTLAGTCGTAILTDAEGIVVGTTFTTARPEEQLMPLGARVGVDLSEAAIGTTAPGITARTSQACAVQGGEHFFGCVQVMYCAAAPIRDVHGRLAAVLDLSSEHRPFSFDAASVVGVYATAIENRLLRRQSDDHLVLQWQVSPALLGTPMEALAGIGRDGRIAWLNGVARRLLGPATTADAECEPVFGHSLDALAALAWHSDARPLCLPNGLTVWLRARLQSRDGGLRVHRLGAPAGAAESAASAAAASPHAIEVPGAVGHAGATLRETDQQLIVRTLQACGGNVSRAARQLGVSRGLVYRHLRPARAKPRERGR